MTFYSLGRDCGAAAIAGRYRNRVRKRTLLIRSQARWNIPCALTCFAP